MKYPVSNRGSQQNKLFKLWEKAYTDGETVFDFTGELHAIEQTKKLYNALTVSRAKARARPVELIRELEIVSCCSLLRISSTCIAIRRNKISAKQIGIDVILNKVMSEQPKQTTDIKSANVLKLFSNRSCQSIA